MPNVNGEHILRADDIVLISKSRVEQEKIFGPLYVPQQPDAADDAPFFNPALKTGASRTVPYDHE